MKITKVHFLEEIPKTSLQKPKRFLLKKYALENNASSNDGNDTSIISDQQESVHTSIENYIINVVQECSAVDRSLIKPDCRLIADIGIDSITVIEVTCRLEAKYHITMDQMISEDLSISKLADQIETLLATSTSTAQTKGKIQYQYAAKERIHYYLFRCIAGLSKLVYKTKSMNMSNLPVDSGYIICANHVSNIDYLFVANRMNKTQFFKLYCLAKQELFNEKFLSNLLVRTCGMIPVNRSGSNANSIKVCEKHLNNKSALLIHPEGTRSKTGELGDFKTGAASLAVATNVPIIPVCIKGAYEVFPTGTKMPRLFDFKNMRRYPVEVIYGEPIYPEHKSIDEITSEVFRAIKVLQKNNEVSLC